MGGRAIRRLLWVARPRAASRGSAPSHRGRASQLRAGPGSARRRRFGGREV